MAGGKEIRLNKLFSGKRNAVVVAVDHGEFYGPVAGVRNLPVEFQKLTKADGVLMSSGMIEHCKSYFYSKFSPTMIVRLNWSSSNCHHWGYKEGHTVQILAPQEAMALGADIVLASLILQTGSEAVDTENVRVFSQIVQNKEKYQIPLMGELYPIGGDKLDVDKLHKVVSITCRIMSELGADLIKTFYTGPKFSEIVKAVPVPIFVLGGTKTKTDLEALELASQSVRAGARGVVFGRNIIQSAQPEKMIEALQEVVNKEANPQEMARKYGLD